MRDTNKMREQFEAAFVAKYGFGRMMASANADAHAMYEAAKWAWEASREAVVIDLSKAVIPGGGYFEDQDAIAAIEAQGLRVKP